MSAALCIAEEYLRESSPASFLNELTSASMLPPKSDASEFSVGSAVGSVTGWEVGLDVGCTVGTGVGETVGCSVGAGVGESVVSAIFGVGLAEEVGSGIEVGDGTGAADGTWAGAEVSTGVTAGNGVLSACIVTICSVDAEQPDSRRKMEIKNISFVFMAYPFQRIYTF